MSFCCHIVDFGTPHYYKTKLEVERHLRKWMDEKREYHQIRKKRENRTQKEIIKDKDIIRECRKEKQTLREKMK